MVLPDEKWKNFYSVAIIQQHRSLSSYWVGWGMQSWQSQWHDTSWNGCMVLTCCSRMKGGSLKPIKGSPFGPPPVSDRMWRIELPPPPLRGRATLDTLKFLACLTNSTSAAGWLKCSSFGSDHPLQMAVARIWPHCSCPISANCAASGSLAFSMVRAYMDHCCFHSRLLFGPPIRQQSCCRLHMKSPGCGGEGIQGAPTSEPCPHWA